MNEIERFKFSFRNAFSGIMTAYKSQRNLRIHFMVGIFVILLAWILQVSFIEFSILLFAILTVIISELLNTAIEFTIDLVSPNYNLEAKKAKDVSAAAVLISAVFAILIGIFIFGPKIYSDVCRILEIIF